MSPTSGDAFSRALALHQSGDLAAAEPLYRCVLAATPDHADALHFLGVLCFQQGRHLEAIESLSRAVALAPEAAFIHSNLGLAQQAAGRTDAAIASFARAIDLDAAFPPALFNLASALHAGEHLEEAAHYYRKALELQPDYADARWNLAALELAAGEWTAGWDNYLARFARPELGAAQQPWRDDAAPEWDGRAPLSGKSVIVYPEGGFGDVLMFARHVPQLAALGARVVLPAPRELLRVLGTLGGVAELIAFDGAGVSLPRCDYKIALFSLPRVLGITPANVPAAPFLRADAAAVGAWRARLDALDPARRLRVGINWAGRADNALEPQRTVPLAQLATLAGPRVLLVSMQKGDAARALAGLPVADLGPDIADFADSAALASALDLVVTSDTALAHLLGALGLDSCILLHRPCDWRWAVPGGGASPWYPKLRLLRQQRPGDWAAPLSELADLVSRAQAKEQ